MAAVVTLALAVPSTLSAIATLQSTQSEQQQSTNRFSKDVEHLGTSDNLEGRLGESGWIYALATHSGVTLGPLLGRLAATELVAGGTASELQSFRPDRLVGRESLPPLEKARSAGQQ